MNPVAGIGGAVGLKGSDGKEVQSEAFARGAKKVSPARAVNALKPVAERGPDIEFLTCSGEMGEDEISSAGLKPKVVYEPKTPSSRTDTISAAKRFLELGAELIVFAGGDGTARDVLEAADGKVPIVGLPSGVKMHSAVFLLSPEDLAGLLTAFVASRATAEAEVMDIDEEMFRKGVLQAKLYGIARVPEDRTHLQAGKAVYHSGTAKDEAEEIGQYIADTMEEGVQYVLGPGSTTAAVAKSLGIEKTVLGVDLVANRRMVITDASEQQLLSQIGPGRAAKVVVTPIGAQGFVFGRGNQQISANVLRRVGLDNIIVIATPTKLSGTPALHVDTGDPDLDAALKGPIKVITGYKRRKLVKVT